MDSCSPAFVHAAIVICWRSAIVIGCSICFLVRFIERLCPEPLCFARVGELAFRCTTHDRTRKKLSFCFAIRGPHFLHKFRTAHNRDCSSDRGHKLHAARCSSFIHHHSGLISLPVVSPVSGLGCGLFRQLASRYLRLWEEDREHEVLGICYRFHRDSSFHNSEQCGDLDNRDNAFKREHDLRRERGNGTLLRLHRTGSDRTNRPGQSAVIYSLFWWKRPQQY